MARLRPEIGFSSLSTEIVTMVFTKECSQWANCARISREEDREIIRRLATYQQVCRFWHVVIERQMLLELRRSDLQLFWPKLRLWVYDGWLSAIQTGLALQQFTTLELSPAYLQGMVLAAKRGDGNVLLQFLRHGLDVNAAIYEDANGQISTVISAAAQYYRSEIVKLLTSCDADINNSKAPALHAAVCSNQPWRYLLDMGADLNSKDEQGLIALAHQIHQRRLTSNILELLDMGADIEVADKDGMTSLLRAIDHRALEIVVELISRGADITARNLNGHFALRILVEYPRLLHENFPALLDHLLLHGADLNEISDGKPLLCWAVLRGCSWDDWDDGVKCLLSRGVDMDQVTHEGESALKLSCKFSDRDFRHYMMGQLLRYYPDVNIADYHGETALMSPFLDKEDVEKLLFYGARINDVNEFGQTALHLAICGKRSCVARYLLARGIDASIRDCHGHTSRLYTSGDDELLKQAFTQWQKQRGLTWMEASDEFVVID